MPRKRPINLHNKRILEKVKLMPFMRVSDIAERTGIPYRKLVDAFPGGRVAKVTRKAAYIARVEKDSHTRWILNTPSVWLVARIRALAPSHSSGEIVEILKREKKESKHLEKVAIPPVATIMGIIRMNRLRTEEEYQRIQDKGNEKQRKNKPNNLTKTQRDRLAEYAHEWIRKNVHYRGRIRMDDLRAELDMMAIKDAIYFQPPTNVADLLPAWDHFLWMKRRYYILKANERFFPKKGRKIKRMRMDESSIEAPPISFQEPRESREERASIRFNPSLTKTERKVFDLASRGLSILEIAQQLGKRRQSIRALQTRIRKKRIPE